jgi:hypothetical protein
LVICACSVALLLLGGIARVDARTLPGEVTKLLALKVELETRGLGYLLDTWTCPPPGQGACDPCGYGRGCGYLWCSLRSATKSTLPLSPPLPRGL